MVRSKADEQAPACQRARCIIEEVERKGRAHEVYEDADGSHRRYPPYASEIVTGAVVPSRTLAFAPLSPMSSLYLAAFGPLALSPVRPKYRAQRQGVQDKCSISARQAFGGELKDPGGNGKGESFGLRTTHSRI